MDNLANRLRLVRAEKGLSQKEAAFACGISARVWQNAEDGRSIRDEVHVLASIAEHLNVDRDWLVWGGPLNGENPHPEGPGGGTVRHQGFEPRTRWYVENPSTEELRAEVVPLFVPSPQFGDEKVAA